ncbi:unnamed protein product, partial [marine sediment metagenome]
MEIEKEHKALLAKLNLLADMMKLHEWTVFRQKEAEKEEEAIDHVENFTRLVEPNGGGGEYVLHWDLHKRFPASFFSR